MKRKKLSDFVNSDIHSDLTKKMLALNDSDLLAFDSALRFFCPKGSECVDCPCYTGYDSRFPLVLCVAIQAHQEAIRRGLIDVYKEEENEHE